MGVRKPLISGRGILVVDCARLRRVFANLSGWHLLILAVVWIIPFLVAVVSIARNRVASGTAKAVWVLIVLLFPWLGLILWFAIGRRSVSTG